LNSIQDPMSGHDHPHEVEKNYLADEPRACSS
jgi:hypothetical protein